MRDYAQTSSEMGIRERHGYEKPTENHVGRNRRDGKSCKYRLCTRHHQQIHQRDEETGKSHIRYEKEGITFYELNSDFIAAFDLYLNTETNLY